MRISVQHYDNNINMSPCVPQPPQPVTPWAENLYTNQTGPYCAQAGRGTLQGQEDCLHLSVYTPQVWRRVLFLLEWTQIVLSNTGSNWDFIYNLINSFEMLNWWLIFQVFINVWFVNINICMGIVAIFRIKIYPHPE